MDISILLIFLALFVMASLSLFLVYKLGFKEKSYEEALAEQRQQTNALLGVKPKPKEKKSKKATKKSKEKITTQDDTESVESEKEHHSETGSQSSKPHVEFKEEPEEVPSIEIENIPIKDIVKTKQAKNVRPILVKKDRQKLENVKLDVVETPIINHFEENAPKDEFELLRSNSKEDLIKHQVDTQKEKPVKERKQDPLKNNKKVSKQTVPPAQMTVVDKPPPVAEEKLFEDKTIETISVTLQSNGLVVANSGKEKKKKKSESNARQLTAERDGIINSVRTADLSKTDVQILIDLLLNKQLEAPDKLDEWTEGKSDPIQKLKKQLSEKEKLLLEEQEALTGAQAKLREIRTEQHTEKAQFQQKIKGLEEALQLKQIELNATTAHHQAGNHKIQHLQVELNNEVARGRKLAEDISVLQMQTQQYEINLGQVQEAEAILAKKMSDIEQLSAQNQALQQIIADEDNKRQHFLMDMTNLEKRLEQQLEYNRQLKETQQDFEKKLEMSLRQENDWKVEISKLNTTLQQVKEEKRMLEHRIDQLNEELRHSRNERPELTKTISMLKSEVNQLQELQNQENGDKEEGKAYEVEILNLTNELSSVRSELSSVRLAMQQKENEYQVEMENSEKKYTKLQNELEEQKVKNNDLRTKNWKLMEALNAAENKYKNFPNQKTDIDLNKIISDITAKQHAVQKQFILRLFPDIQELQTATTTEDWQIQFGTLIGNYVNNLKKQSQNVTQSPLEVTKLQTEVLRYKAIIDETEGMLEMLQHQVQSQEINWQKEIITKETQIESLKREIEKLSRLENKVLKLENQLKEVDSDKQRLVTDAEFFKTQPRNASQQADATATMEKLTEEVNSLREQLRTKQTKNGDMCLEAQNNCNTSTNGPAFIERCLSSSSSIASSVIEDIKKPKNKKRKKKMDKTEYGSM